MTIGDWLRQAARALEASGCPDPRVDSRYLAEDLLGMNRQTLLFEADHTLTPAEEGRLDAALQRRLKGEPLQYILGTAPFMGMTFEVSPGVLIPRQDTETLAEALVVALSGHREARLLDLCCGSGIIGLSVKTLCPQVQVTLTDVSREALETTRQNARRLNVEVEIRSGDLFQAVEKERFDLIACNPPYIPTGELQGLQTEVQWEPKLALDGGEDGLDFYRRIAAGAGEHLLPGGTVYLEVGAGQAPQVRAMMEAALPATESGVLRDLNGIERVVWARS